MSSATVTPARREHAERIGRWLDSELAGRGVPPLLVLIGLGDGTVLDAIDARAPGTRVLALEPDPHRARAFLAAPEWQAWRSSGRLVYLADPDYTGADQAWRIFPRAVTTPTILLHPDTTMSDGVGRASQRLKHIIFGVAANAEARRLFAPRYLVNAIRNLPAIVAGSNVSHLADAYRGVPAIVAGAGPSLDAAIRELRTMPDRGLLIAADTALRPLLAAGIAPSLAVALDPSDVNARHLLSLPECKDTWLVSEAALDRQATAVFDRRTFWFRASDHHPGPWFNELGLDLGHLEVWGSVLTGAFQVACLAGCDPIVLVGADLSFTGDRPYARGTTYEINWADAVSAGTPLSDVWRSAVSTGQPAPDLRGGTTRTTPALVSFRDWMLAQAAQSGRRVVNATGAGILFGNGIEQAALGDVLSHAISIPPVSAVARRWPNVRPTAMAAQVRKVRTMLTAGSPSPLVAAWKDFSGDGFDAAAVGAALDDAARGLETKLPGPTKSALDPWAQSDTAAAMADLLPRLPETIGRMPQGLIGGGGGSLQHFPMERGGFSLSESPDAPAERAARLIHAWDLFERICASVLRRGDDLTLVADASSIGYVSVGTVYAWPDSTRWAVAMFEGLLGDAWASSRLAPAFCSRALLPGLDTADRSRQPNAECACALLALEWLRCAGASPELCAALADSLRVDAVLIATGGAATVTHGAAVVVELSRASQDAELRFSFSGPALSLIHTGALAADVVQDMSRRETYDVAATLRLVHIDFPALTEAFATRPAATPGPAVIAPAPHRDLHIQPRVLTGSTRLFIAYQTAEGAACVKPHTHQSVIVESNGAIRPHRTWPHAISGELPLGDHGAVAWSHGLSRWPDIEPARVMYRRHADDDVIVEELAFRPAFGQWWGGRLYWSCFSRIDGWHGVASWIPGEAMREETAQVTAWAASPDTDGLVIHPCDFTPSRGYRRRRQSIGWKWRPGRPLESIGLGRYGSISSRAANRTLTATTHPDTDVVQIESKDGGASAIICPYPQGVAWVGSSLLVGTQQGELLLFDDCVQVIERSLTCRIRNRH